MIQEAQKLIEEIETNKELKDKYSPIFLKKPVYGMLVSLVAGSLTENVKPFYKMDFQSGLGATFALGVEYGLMLADLESKKELEKN